MRVASAAGCFASATAWAVLAFAQSAAPPPGAAPATPPATSPPPAAPPTAPEAPAPSTPPAEPSPTAPAPSGIAPQPEQPGPNVPSDTTGRQPAEPAPPPPSETTPPTPPSPPAMADQQPATKDAPPVDAGSERAHPEPRKSDPWRDGHALALELSGRISGRLNAASTTATYEERAGVGLDAALWFTLGTHYALGLAAKRADLGEISYSEGVNNIDAGYAATALELGLRAFPWRSDDWELFVGLRAGLAWQDVEANGLQQLGPMPDSAVPFRCSGGSGPGFALGAEVGAAFRLSRHLWLLGTVDANGYRLTSDRVDECVAGIGSITTLSGGLGVLYAFDLGEGAKL